MGIFRRLFPGAAKSASKPVAVPVHPRTHKLVRLPGGEGPKVGGKPLSIPGTGKPVAEPAGRPVATPVRPKALRQAMTLGRAEPPTGRRTSTPVAHTMADAFIAGTDTYVTSSWLKMVRYHRDTEDLDVWFLDGFHCTVHQISEAEARDFYAAPSKGGWYWDNVLGQNYPLGHPHMAKKHWS